VQLRGDPSVSRESYSQPAGSASAIPLRRQRLRPGDTGPEVAVRALDPDFAAAMVKRRVTANGRLPALIPATAVSIQPAAHRTLSLSIGNLLYLVSVGVVAAATIAVFFGIALSLLRQPANAPVSEWPLGGRGNDVGTVPQVSLPRGGAAPGDTATAPAAPKKSQPLRAGAAFATSPPAVVVARRAPWAAARTPSEAAAKAPAAPRLPDRQIAELVGRGDVFLRAGDVASARLFYERAAEAGDGHAALLVGATFDPTFLARFGLRNMPGDPAKARFWYHRALGPSGAEIQLNSIESK
jgi:hypothetical protein